MKRLILVGMLLLAIPIHVAQSELSQSDLQRIQEIVRAEIKTEIAASETRIRSEITTAENRLRTEIFNSEKKMKEYSDLKFEATDAKTEAVATRVKDLAGYLNITNMLLGAMIALIVAGIGIPQIILAWKSRRQDETRPETEPIRDQLAPTPQQYTEMQKEQAETRALIQQLQAEIEHLRQSR